MRRHVSTSSGAWRRVTAPATISTSAAAGSAARRPGPTQASSGSRPSASR
jgi:hypothetical protein